MGHTEKSLTKLQQERAELLAEADRLQALAVELEGDDLAEVEAQIDGILDTVEGHDGKIARAKRILDKLNEQEKPRATPVQLDLPKKEEPKVKVPATCLREPVKNFRREEINGMQPHERAYAFGRYLLATAARTSPGQYGHLAKYVQQHEDAFGPMNAATESGNAGLYVPTEFSSDIVELLLAYGVARRLCDTMTMGRDKLSFPKLGSDPTAAWTSEGGSITDITPTDDSLVTLTAKKLTGILIYSSELNEDAIAGFGDGMLMRLANAFASAEDNAWANGDGQSGTGGIIGLRTLLQDIDGAGTDAAGLTTGAGTTWASLTLANFEDVAASLPDFSNSAEDNARWVCSRAFYYSAMVRLQLGSGGVTSMEIGDGRRTPMMLGWPVEFSNQFPRSTAVGSVVCTFGDHRRACAFGDRRAYSIDFSREATVGSVDLWETDQIGIRATERVDIKNHSLGDATNAGAVVGLETAAS